MVPVPGSFIARDIPDAAWVGGGQSAHMSTRAATATAMLVVIALAAACGGGPGFAGSSRSGAAKRTGKISIVELSTCLKQAGARVSSAAGPESEPGAWVEQGAILATIGGDEAHLDVLSNDAGAHALEYASVGLLGVTQVDGVPIQRMIGRAGNVLVTWSQRPTAAASRTLEGCLGRSPRIDPDIAAMIAAFGPGPCSEAVVAALSEFRQYIAESDQPSSFETSCGFSFTTADPQAKVVAYYRDQLVTHGWTPDEPGGDPVVLVAAHRRRLHFSLAREELAGGSWVASIEGR
jgi:hypothetical protein